MSRAEKRTRVIGATLLVGTSVALTSVTNAHAFVTKHTAKGAPVHWESDHVSFVVDDSVTNAVSGAVPSIDAAAQAWSGAAGGPGLSAAAGEGGSQPAVDGKNTILYAAQGYAPAGSALAITVLSYDEDTGAIVDADIVINGKHAFAVLASNATAPAGTEPVSTEGSSGSSNEHLVFDLQHVVAHEVGHALGLGDEPSDQSDLMYPYTMPEDASVRAPASDDLAGVDSLYAGAAPSASSHGCGGASVAGGRLGGRDAGAAWSLIAVGGAWLLSRRRARAVVPWAAACVVFVSSPVPARSAPQPSAIGAASDATARVVGVETSNVGGVFETVVELAPTRCSRPSACPAHVRAHAWGGTVGGITQQVGEMPAPRMDDEVDLAFTGEDESAADLRVTLLEVRRP